MRTLLNLSASMCLSVLVLAPAHLWADPPPMPPDPLSMLHVLVVADTNADNIGASVRIDGDHMASVLTNGVPEKRLDLKRLDGANAAPDKILAYYKSLKDSIKPDEALAFFYAGHGATIDGQHTLTMKAGPLKRKDLLDAMKGTNAALVVCLTDCCSNQITGGPAVFSQGAPEDNPVIRNLFFQARGVVDVTASTLDGSMGDDTNGGFFTHTLTNALRDEPKNLAGPNDNGFVAWPAFFEKVRKGTSEVCAQYVDKQRSLARTPEVDRQVPFAWSLGDQPKGVPVVDAPPPLKPPDAKDVFDQLLAQSKKLMGDLKTTTIAIGKGKAVVVTADPQKAPAVALNPVVFNKAPVEFGVKVWAALAGKDGKETGTCVCLPKYQWHANEYFYVYLECTTPVQVAFYQGYPENGMITKTQQVLPDPTFPESYGTVLPGQAYKFPTLIKLDDSREPEYMAIVCSAVGSSPDSVVNQPDAGTRDPVALADAQRRGMDKALDRAKDLGAKGRFVGAVPSIDVSNVGGAPVPSSIDLKTTSTNPDDVSVVQFGSKGVGYTLFKLSK